MAGVNQNVSKMGTFFEKYVPHFMPIFEKKSHPIRPVEGLKLCLDFLCNVRNVLIFETFWFTPAMHRPLTVKGVYVVSHS